VSVARRLAESAAIKAVVHDGVRIETVKHLGRYIPAELRTALALGGPPDFDGVVCTDCGTRHGIQYDHIDPVANRGPTTQRNLTGRCWDCHEKKTEADRQAGLLGGNRNGKGARRAPP
jgi:5-methylcytosine-specific restriction endonuclease McrA